MRNSTKENVRLYVALVFLLPLMLLCSPTWASSQRGQAVKNKSPKHSHYQMKGDIVRRFGLRVHASIRVNNETGQSKLTLRTGPLSTELFRNFRFLHRFHFWETMEVNGTTKLSKSTEGLFKNSLDLLPKGRDLQEKMLVFTPEKQDRIVMRSTFRELRFYNVGDFMHPNQLLIQLENDNGDGWLKSHDTRFLKDTSQHEANDSVQTDAKAPEQRETKDSVRADAKAPEQRETHISKRTDSKDQSRLDDVRWLGSLVKAKIFKTKSSKRLF